MPNAGEDDTVPAEYSDMPMENISQYDHLLSGSKRNPDSPIIKDYTPDKRN